MRAMAEDALTELQNCPYGMLKLVKGLNANITEVEGGRCMKGSDGKLCLREKERGKVWKDYMKRIINEENGWDHVDAVEGVEVDGDAVEGPVVCVSREEMLQALNEMKTGKALGPSEVSLEMIANKRRNRSSSDC